MGCDGCELWTPTIRKCYAGRQTADRAGNKGWPSRFEDPVLFLDRLEPALKWGPPTEKEREAKPWIPAEMPRLIFLNDMGDTFSRKLPLNWMAPVLSRLAECPSQFLLLTKRPSRLVEFAERFPLPPNVWPGTSVTSAKTVNRIEMLRKLTSGGPKFVSFEPLWSQMPQEAFAGIQWAIFGGESGNRRTPDEPVTECRLEWLDDGVSLAQRHGARAFVKQVGSYSTLGGIEQHFKDSHGGDWNEWPTRLRVREFPEIIIPAKQADLL